MWNAARIIRTAKAYRIWSKDAGFYAHICICVHVYVAYMCIMYARVWDEYVYLCMFVHMLASALCVSGDGMVFDCAVAKSRLMTIIF